MGRMSMLDSLNHRSRRQEQQGLEEGVRQQVKHPGHVGADAYGRDHETQLADRGIGQDPLDVELRHRNARCEQGGSRSHQGDYIRRPRCHLE